MKGQIQCEKAEKTCGDLMLTLTVETQVKVELGQGSLSFNL